MSDVSKGLQRACGARWVLATSAGLLTVVSGVLGWLEVANGGSPAPRSFVFGIAMVVWIAWIALTCSLLVIKQVNKRIDRWGNRVVAALCEKRLTNLADLMEEDGNIRSIRRR